LILYIARTVLWRHQQNNTRWCSSGSRGCASLFPQGGAATQLQVRSMYCGLAFFKVFRELETYFRHTVYVCSPANAFAHKMYNWSTLNAKVLHKLGFSVPKPLCEAAARAAPMAVEKILKFLRYKFAELMEADEQLQVTPWSDPRSCDICLLIVTRSCTPTSCFSAVPGRRSSFGATAAGEPSGREQHLWQAGSNI
jgi:hypothetical protein